MVKMWQMVNGQSAAKGPGNQDQGSTTTQSILRYFTMEKWARMGSSIFFLKYLEDIVWTYRKL